MADVLAMSEQAGVLAGNIGGYLFDRGSTAEIKNLGSAIVRTAGSLMAEVRARRTRKAPAASASALRSATGTTAAAGSALGGVPVNFPRVPRVGANYSKQPGRLITASAATESALAAAPAPAAIAPVLGSIKGPASIPLKRNVRGVLRPLPSIVGEPPAPAKRAQNAALKDAEEQVRAAAAAAKPGILRKAAEVVGLRKPAAAPSPFAPRLPLSSLVEEEPEENAEEEEVPAGSPAAAASRMAGLFGAADTLPGAAATLNAAKAALVKKGQKGGRHRTRKARKH
jgi:hypothetical protein